MKKLLYAIRKWLIDILGGVPMCLYDSMASLANHFNEQINDYRVAIREICRRSENTYYDWCCDQCACDCDKIATKPIAQITRPIKRRKKRIWTSIMHRTAY